MPKEAVKARAIIDAVFEHDGPFTRAELNARAMSHTSYVYDVLRAMACVPIEELADGGDLRYCVDEHPTSHCGSCDFAKPNRTSCRRAPGYQEAAKASVPKTVDGRVIISMDGAEYQTYLRFLEDFRTNPHPTDTDGNAIPTHGTLPVPDR